MVGVVDAGRIIRPVKIGDTEVICTGVSLDGLVLLLDRFPEFKRLITPQRGEIDTADLSVEGLLKLGPRIIGAVIAAGTDEPGVQKAEDAAKLLPIGYQVKLVKEIMDLTFPGGIGPFVDDLRAMGLLGLAEEPSKPNGASAGTGKEPDTNSSSSQPGSTSEVIQIQ